MAIKLLNGVDVQGSMNITAADIPNLDASKITSGTIPAARMSSLDASKVGAGVFHADRVPNLPASKITSGTISADRLPTIADSKISSASNWNTAYGWGNHAGLYDAVDSALAVHSRIDTEVLPAIPTNNNQLTNGAGYITSYVNTQRTDEEIANVLSEQLYAGSNINLEPYEGRIMISAWNTQRTDDQIRSVVREYFSPGPGISFDRPVTGAFTIASSITPRTDAEIANIIDEQLYAGSNINIEPYEGRLMISTYGPGTGLLLNGFNEYDVQSDLRGVVQLIGSSTADYINVTNTYIDFVLDNAVDMRLYNNGALHVESDVIAFSTTISDKRFKDDIVTIDSALDKVKKLRGVEYTWNTGSRKGKKDLGLIAQEVEEVLPEIVHEHEMPLMQDAEEGKVYKTVDYEKMVGVLIEAIKELSAEVEQLKSK